MRQFFQAITFLILLGLSSNALADGVHVRATPIVSQQPALSINIKNQWLLAIGVLVLGLGVASVRVVKDESELDSELGGFGKVLEDLELPAAVTKKCGRLVLSNDQLISLFSQLGSHDPAETNLCELLVSHADVSAQPESIRDLQAAVEKCGSSPVPQQLVLHCRNRVSLSVSISPQVSNPDTCYLLWVLRDVGIDSRLEERDQHHQKMQTITRFAGGMAHEFNNLLTAILGNFELIRARPDVSVSSVIGNLESAEVAALRASQLIQELRRFASREVPLREVKSIPRAIRQTRRILAGSVARNIEVTHSFENEASLYALINSGQLQEALLKLGMNAAEAIGGTAGRIHFEVGVVDDESGNPIVRIDVSDSGHGMCKLTRERAFEPLFTTRDESRAAGLGMSIAHGLIEEMGGQIRIADTSDFGSVVSVTLPMVPPVSSVEDDSSVAPPTLGLKIGTLDNERSIRKVVLGMLSLLGHEAQTFVDGAELIDAFENGQRFDLLLIDHVMPGMTGRATYQRIRELDPDVRVVICSGQHLDVSRFCLECERQPDGFLKKPFSMEELASLLAAMD